MTSPPFILSGVQQAVLEGLGTYRVLTADRMQRLGIGRDLKNLRACLRALKEAKHIHSVDWGFTPGAGRNPALHMLAPKGAAALNDLAERPEPIQAARVGSQAVQHIPHWLGVIDCHIALRTWAAAHHIQVDWVRTEYERSSSLKRATTIEAKGLRYIPDAVAQITPPDGKPRLLVLEYYRQNAQHAVKQLAGLKAAHDQALVESHFTPGSSSRARFLLVFDTPELCQRVQAAWPDKANTKEDAFYLKAADELGAFGENWLHPTGERRHLLPNGLGCT